MVKPMHSAGETRMAIVAAALEAHAAPIVQVAGETRMAGTTEFAWKTRVAEALRTAGEARTARTTKVAWQTRMTARVYAAHGMAAAAEATRMTPNAAHAAVATAAKAARMTAAVVGCDSA